MQTRVHTQRFHTCFWSIEPSQHTVGSSTKRLVMTNRTRQHSPGPLTINSNISSPLKIWFTEKKNGTIKRNYIQILFQMMCTEKHTRTTSNKLDNTKRNIDTKSCNRGTKQLSHSQKDFFKMNTLVPGVPWYIRWLHLVLEDRIPFKI